jgi:Leucine-rich repeat (LRR) protein
VNAPHADAIGSTSQQAPSARIWPIVFYLIALWSVDFFAYPGLMQWMATGRLVPLLVSGLLFGIIAGQACWLAVIGGLYGRCWLAGITLASVLAGISLAAVLIGQSWQYFFSLYNLPELAWGAFAIPALVLAESAPLFGMRRVLRWRLTWQTKVYHERNSGSLEEWFVATAAIASLLFMCRVPFVAWETTAQSFFLPLLAVPAMLAGINLFLTVPAVYLMFRVEPAWRRWVVVLALIFLDSCLLFGIVIVSNMLIATPNFSYAEPLVLSASVGVTAGFLLIVGLEVLRSTGLRLEAAGAVTKHDEAGLQTAYDGRQLHRRWATGVFLLAAAASISLWRLEAWRQNSDERNLSVYRELEIQDGSVDVREHDIVGFKLPPNAKDSELTKYLAFRDVETLSLANTQVTWAGLANLKNFPKLTALDVSNLDIGDRGLSELKKLNSLYHLSLAGTHVTDDQLAGLLSALNLTSLDVGHLGLNDDFLMMLPSYARTVPSSLTLTGNNITDAGLQSFFASYGSAIRKLDLSGTLIDGSGLASNVALDELVLDSVPLTDAVFGPVLANLWIRNYLVLRNTELTNSVLPWFAKATKIRGLELGDGKITDEGLIACGPTTFERLKLSGKQFTGRCFEKWHPNIYELSLSGSSTGDEEVRYLAKLPNLHIVDLSNTSVTDAALPALAKNAVYRLDLSHTLVTAAGLRSVDLSLCSEIRIALGQFTLDEVRDLKKILPIVVGLRPEP